MYAVIVCNARRDWLNTRLLAWCFEFLTCYENTVNYHQRIASSFLFNTTRVSFYITREFLYNTRVVIYNTRLVLMQGKQVWAFEAIHLMRIIDFVSVTRSIKFGNHASSQYLISTTKSHLTVWNLLSCSGKKKQTSFFVVLLNEQTKKKTRRNKNSTIKLRVT